MLKKSIDHLKGISAKQGFQLLGQMIKHASPEQISQLLVLLEVLAPGRDLKLKAKIVKEDFQKKGPWYTMLKKLLTTILHFKRDIRNA